MFEIGKKYKNSKGDIVTITRVEMGEDLLYPVTGRNEVGALNSYTLKGYFYDDERDCTSNLIDEVVVETPFMVGYSYYTQNGKVALITDWISGLTYGLIASIDSDTLSFTAEGRFYDSGDTDGYDLMLDQVVIEPERINPDIPISFSNQRDVWAYLMLGGLVQNTINSEVYGFYRGILTEYDIHGDTKFSLLVVPCDIGFTYANQWVKHTPVEKAAPRWEDNLQLNTVLCWVSDQDDVHDTLRLVNIYTKETNYPYEDMDGNTWAFATPLTLENARQLIYECQPRK
jgi:hypothetical protein